MSEAQKFNYQTVMKEKGPPPAILSLIIIIDPSTRIHSLIHLASLNLCQIIIVI